jgi:uncharacterized peroxidase-related enzyme
MWCNPARTNARILKMPRINPVNAATTDDETNTTLGAIKAKIGMVPNLYATFAQSPSVLNGFLALSDSLSKGALTPAQREIVALATAQANQCHYCLSAHTLLGKNAGLSADAIAAARNGKADDAQDNAVATLAAALVEARGSVSDADVAAARNGGLDDARIVEVIAHVALNVMTNFTNNVAQTDIDFPVVDLAIAA